MIKGAAIAAMVLFIAVQVDQHYDNGFYTDGSLSHVPSNTALFRLVEIVAGHFSVGGLYPSFAAALFTWRGIDFTLRPIWLLDDRKSGAIAGGTLLFRRSSRWLSHRSLVSLQRRQW